MPPHSVEDAKLSLARWLDQAGVVLYLQTQAVDVRMEGNRLSGIVASTPEGLGMLSCRVAVDATGDGRFAPWRAFPVPSAGQRMGSRSRRLSCSPSVGWSRISPVPMSRTTHPSAGRVIWPCVRKPAGMASCRPTSPSSVCTAAESRGADGQRHPALSGKRGAYSRHRRGRFRASRADGAGAVLPAPSDPGI